jgi:hypothetical protein
MFRRVQGWLRKVGGWLRGALARGASEPAPAAAAPPPAAPIRNVAVATPVEGPPVLAVAPEKPRRPPRQAPSPRASEARPAAAAPAAVSWSYCEACGHMVAVDATGQKQTGCGHS